MEYSVLCTTGYKTIGLTSSKPKYTSTLLCSTKWWKIYVIHLSSLLHLLFSISEARCVIKLHTYLVDPTPDKDARIESHQHRLVKQLPDCCICFFYNPGKFAIVCSTTLLTVQISIIERLDDYELGRKWKQAVTAYFKVPSRRD